MTLESGNTQLGYIVTIKQNYDNIFARDVSSCYPSPLYTSLLEHILL